MTPTPNFCGRTRREFLWEAGAGFTGLGARRPPSQDGFFARTPPTASRPIRSPPTAAALRRPRPRASSSCSCTAGPARSIPSTTSRAVRLDGKTDQRSRPSAAAATKNEGRVVGPKWKFKQYGQCGK